MNDALPRRLTGFAALGLAACAVAGIVLGATKASPTSADSRAGAVDTEGVPLAKPLSAGSGALDEAAVRKIAREEARATLAKTAKDSDASVTQAKGTDQASASKSETDKTSAPKRDGSKLAKVDAPAAAAPDGADQPPVVHHRKRKPVADAGDGSSTSEPAAPPVVPARPPQPAQVPDQY